MPCTYIDIDMDIDFVHPGIVRRVDVFSPDRGYGFFATCRIKAGTVVLAETPLLPPRSRTGSTEKNAAYLIKTAMATCPDAFMALAPRSVDDVWLKYKRNAFTFAGYPALLFNGAVFNHACDPNVKFAVNKDKTQMIFTAMRDIAAGEELCDSYTTKATCIADAHARLKSQYGFQCTCSVRRQKKVI